MLEGMNYLHAKFQINIFRNKKVIKLLELLTLWLKKKKKKRKKNSEYNRVVITTIKKRAKVLALRVCLTIIQVQVKFKDSTSIEKLNGASLFKLVQL